MFLFQPSYAQENKEWQRENRIPYTEQARQNQRDVERQYPNSREYNRKMGIEHSDSN